MYTRTCKPGRTSARARTHAHAGTRVYDTGIFSRALHTAERKRCHAGTSWEAAGDVIVEGKEHASALTY